MKENHYIARIVQYIATKYQEIKLKNYNRKIKEYLVKNHVRGDFHTLKIPLTTQIYTGGGYSKLHIGKGMKLGEYCVVDANDSYGIYIGNNLLAARDVFIRGGNHDYSFSELPFQVRGHCAKKIPYKQRTYSIVIEDNVWIGRGATILSGAHIGKGCVIGAGAVVKEYIPEYSIVIGNPAKIVTNRKKYLDFSHRKDIGLFK